MQASVLCLCGTQYCSDVCRVHCNAMYYMTFVHAPVHVYIPNTCIHVYMVMCMCQDVCMIVYITHNTFVLHVHA